MYLFRALLSIMFKIVKRFNFPFLCIFKDFIKHSPTICFSSENMESQYNLQKCKFNSRFYFIDGQVLHSDYSCKIINIFLAIVAARLICISLNDLYYNSLICSLNTFKREFASNRFYYLVHGTDSLLKVVSVDQINNLHESCVLHDQNVMFSRFFLATAVLCFCQIYIYNRP